VKADKNHPRLESTAFVLLMTALVSSVLLFGAFSTYAYSLAFLMVLGAGTLLIIGSFSKGPKGTPWQFLRPETPFYPLCLAFSLFLIFQMTPLPVRLMEKISPESYVQSEKSLPPDIIRAVERRHDPLMAAAPYVYPVRQSLIRWVVYSVFFLGMIRVLNTRRRLEQAVLILIACGCFEAVYGLIQVHSAHPHIWWAGKRAYRGFITGTYINRNHFAAFLEMVIMLSIGYAAAISTSSGQRNSAFRKKVRGVRGHLNRWLSMEGGFSKKVFVIFTAAMGIGLVFSGSRGAMISFSGGLLLTGLLLGLKKKHRRKGFLVLVLFMMTLFYGLQLGMEKPLSRFKTFVASYETRSEYARETLQLFWDYPMTGVGLGNFQHAFPRYQVVTKKQFMWHAHNDWIQFLAESGMAGFVIFLAAMAYYLLQMFKRWRRRKSNFAVGLGTGSFAAAAAIAVHSYSDFSLHFPANCLVLAAIMAIGHNALHLRFHSRYRSESHHLQLVNLRWGGAITCTLTIALVAWAWVWTIRHFVAEAYCNTVPDQTLNLDQRPPENGIRTAIALDGSNAAYHYKLALALIQQRDLAANAGVEKRLPIKYNSEIIKHLETAVRLNPLNAWHHMRLGWEYTFLWQSSDYHQKWLPAADIAMERAAYHAGEKTPYLHRELGNYWTMRSRTLLTDPRREEVAWARACWHYKKAVSLESSRWRKHVRDTIKNYIRQHYQDDARIRQALGE